MNKLFNPPDKWTALTKHAWNQDHKFDFNAVNILDRSRNYKKRMILEMTHIASKPHVVNQRTDTENLSVFYLPLLYTYILIYILYTSLVNFSENFTLLRYTCIQLH